MFLKICRLRDPENIRDVIEMMPNMIGFDFSPLRVSYMGEVDEALLSDIPLSIRKVGVFMNEPPIEIAAISGKFTLNSVQLDGDTSSADCELLSAEGLEVIKSFYISEPDSFYKTEAYEGVCNRFIFKLSTTLDYSILNHYKGRTPFLLSMKMDNIEIPFIDHPKFCGFDTANSCESEPAIKNIEALKSLVDCIKSSFIKYNF